MPFPALPSLPSAPAAGAAALHAYSQYTTSQANAWASGAKDMALPMIILNYWMAGGAAMDTWVGTFMVLAIFALLNIMQTDEGPTHRRHQQPPMRPLAAAARRAPRSQPADATAAQHRT